MAIHTDTQHAPWTHDGHKWDVLTEYAWREGRWVVIGSTVRCPHDPPHPLRREVRDAAPMQAPPTWSMGFGPAAVQPDGTWTGPPTPRPGRPPIPPDHYRQVANVYLLAKADGRPPRQAVMRAFDLKSERTASRHIETARRLGLLLPRKEG